MGEDKFLDLSIKFLGNELTSVELEEFQQYLKEDQYKKRFDIISEQWNRAADNLEAAEFNSREAFKRFVARIEVSRQNDFSPKKKVTIFRLFQTPVFVRIAASLVFIVVVSIILLNSTEMFETKKATAEWQEKITKPGEKSTLTFIDGTKIVLNAESKLRYKMNSQDSTREVYLEGEAYFNVAHDPSRPFIVHVNNISTTVLGTKFNISAFEADNEIEVSLVEGKVRVDKKETDNDEKEVILKPSQQLVYEKDKDKSIVQPFDVQSVTGWKDNILIFNGEPLDDVFTELERAYGVKFELKETGYKNFSVTANFKNASFITILEVIKKLTELDYTTEKENNAITRVIYYKK